MKSLALARSVLFFCNSVSISSIHAQVPEIIAGGASLTGLISGLKGLAKQIEDSGHSLIEHGNAALGQQQVLMASTLNATISQFEQAYKSSLTLTFDKVDVQTQNAYKELDKTVKNADKIRTATVTDAQHLIYQTQGAANQLLGTRTRQMALVAITFSLTVTFMVTYQSVRQIQTDREYRTLHAVYTVRASIKGTVRTTAYSEPLTFRGSSGQINVGCNDAQSTSAVWSIPEGATDVQATANWENTNNIRSETQTVNRSETTISASGSISGLERSFLGNCPGGRHGELVLRGTYRIARNESSAEQTLKTLEDKVNKGQPFIIAIPQDSGVVPEFCDITVEEGKRRETIRIALQMGPGNVFSVRQQQSTGDIPVSATLDKGRIILVIL